MNPSWIWSDKITNKRVARVGYNHFISNKGEWNNCFSKFSNRVLPPIFISTIFQSVRKENLAHYFPYDVKLGLLAHSRSFLANQMGALAVRLDLWLGSLSTDVFEPRTSTGSLCFSFSMFSCPTNELPSSRFSIYNLTFWIKRAKYTSKRRSLDFQLTSVAQKRLCLSSLITNPNGRPMLPFDWLIHSSLILASCRVAELPSCRVVVFVPVFCAWEINLKTKIRKKYKQTGKVIYFIYDNMVILQRVI